MKNRIIRKEMSQWIWNVIDSTRNTNCMLRRQGFPVDDKIFELLVNEHLRTVFKLIKIYFISITMIRITNIYMIMSKILE